MVDNLRKRASSIFSSDKSKGNVSRSEPPRLSVDVLLHAIAPAPVNPQPPEGDDEPPLLDVHEGRPNFGHTSSMPAGVGGRFSRHLAEEALAAIQTQDQEDEVRKSRSFSSFARPGKDSEKGGPPRQSFGHMLGDDLVRRIKSEHEAAAADPNAMVRVSSMRSSNSHSAGGPPSMTPRGSLRSRGQRSRHSHSRSSTFGALFSGGQGSGWRESIKSAGNGIRKSGSELLRRASNAAGHKDADHVSAARRRSSVQSIASAIASLARASQITEEEPASPGILRASNNSMDEERFHRSGTEMSAAGVSVASSLRSTDVFVYDFFVLACPRAFKSIGRRLRFSCLRVASTSIARLIRTNREEEDILSAELAQKKGEAPAGSYSKAETEFQDEMADLLSDGSSENLSDIEEHPWQEYFTHRKNYAHSVWDLVAGVPTSERVLLNKIGIEVTKKKDLREFLRSIKGTKRLPSVHEGAEDGNGEASNKDVPSTSDDLSEVLGDSLVDWSYYDLFEPDRRPHEPFARWLISGFSTLARISEEALLCIAFFSTWYATLVFSFREVIAADRIFGPDTVIYRFLACLDVVLDGVYLMLTLLRLRTTIVDPSAYKEVTRPRAILRTLFSEPMFCCEFLTSVVMPVRIACGLQSTFSLQIGTVRVLRVGRVLFPPQSAVRSARHWVWSMLKFVLLLLLAGHLWGCAWFLMADSSMKIQKHPLILEAAPDRVAAFHETPWALALYYSYAWRLGVYLVIGADWVGMSSNENLMAAAMAPIGALISAIVFSQVIVMMQRDSAVQTMYAKHVIEVKQALATLDLPRYLQLRILAFYAYQQLHRSEHVSHSLRRMLSPQLQFELHLVLYYGLVKKSRLFHSAPPKVLREIVVVLKDRIFLPGDFVYRARDEAKEMFFICKGSCSILDQDLQTQHQILRIGDSFGEIPLLCGHPHISYIRAGTYCILAILSKGHFEGVMRLYPKMAEILLKQMSQQERELMQKRTSFQAAVRRRSSLGRRFSRVPSFSAGRANSLVNGDPAWQQKIAGSEPSSPLQMGRSQRRSMTEPGMVATRQMGSSGLPIYSPRPSGQPARSTIGGLGTPRLSTASLGTIRSRQASMMSGGPNVNVQQWKQQGNSLRVPQLQRPIGGGTPVPTKGTANRPADQDGMFVSTPLPAGKLQGKLRKSDGDSSSSDDGNATAAHKGRLKSTLQGAAARRKSVSDVARRKSVAEHGQSAPMLRRKSSHAILGSQDESDSPKPARRKSVVQRRAEAESCPASLRRSSVLDSHGRRKSITAIAMEAGNAVAMGNCHTLPGLHPGLMPLKAQEETPVEEQIIVEEEAPLPAPASPPSDSGHTPISCFAEGAPMAAWASESQSADDNALPQSTGVRSSSSAVGVRSSLREGTSGHGVRSSLTVPSRSSRSRSAETGTRRSVTLAINVASSEAGQPSSTSTVEEEAVVPFSQGEADCTSDEADPSRNALGSPKSRKSVTMSSKCEEVQIESRKKEAASVAAAAAKKETDADEAQEEKSSSSSSSSDSEEQPDEDADFEPKAPAPRKMSITVQKVEEANDSGTRTSGGSVKSSGPVSILECGSPLDANSDAGDDDDRLPPRSQSMGVTINRERDTDAVGKSLSIRSIKSDNSVLSFTQSIPSINSNRSQTSRNSGVVQGMASYMQEKGAKLREFSRRKKDSGGRSVTGVTGVISKAVKTLTGSNRPSEHNSRATSRGNSRSASTRGSRHQSRSASRNISRIHSSRPSNPASRQDSRRPSLPALAAEPRTSGPMTESMQLAQKLEELLHQQERDQGTRGSTGSVSTLTIPTEAARHGSNRSSLSRQSISSDYRDGDDSDGDDDLGTLEIPATIHARADQMAFVTSQKPSVADPVASARLFDPASSARSEAWQAKKTTNQTRSSMEAQPSHHVRSTKDSRVLKPTRSMSWPCSKRDFTALQFRLQRIIAAGSPTDTASVNTVEDSDKEESKGSKFVSSPPRMSGTSSGDKQLDPYESCTFGSFDPVSSEGFLDIGLPLTLSARASPPHEKSKDWMAKTEHNTNLMVVVTDTVVAATKATRSVLKDLNLVAGEMRDLTKAVVGICDELRDAVPKENVENHDGYCMENSMEEGGFGALEVTQTMDMVMRQIKVLQSIADKVSMQLTSNQGADEVIIEAMTCVEPTDSKLEGVGSGLMGASGEGS